jgi:hypothetical protein
MLPFKEEKINKNLFIRKFSKDLMADDLCWHKDKEDRLVRLISGEEWLFQKDNELPFKISKDKDIFIPKNTWHRLIRGTSDLVIKVVKLK